MRRALHSSQITDRARAGTILLQIMRSFRQPNPQTQPITHTLSDLWREVRQVPFGSKKSEAWPILLFPPLLVLIQSARQSLSLDWRPRRANEPGRLEMAQGRPNERQISLPHLPPRQAPRGSSYPPVQQGQEASLGRIEWSNALP